MLCGALLGSAPVLDARGRDVRFALPASDVDRINQTVALQLPVDAPQPASLRDPNDFAVPFQIDDEHLATFIVPRQKAGEVLVYTLASANDAHAAVEIEVVPRFGDLLVSIAGAPMLGYRMDKGVLPRAGIEDKFRRSGYLHPVFSPAGKMVTGDFPLNHVHHHGIWTAWSRTSFRGRSPNFWEMGEQTGTVEFVALDRPWSGAVQGGFVARQRMVDLSAAAPVTVLNETWKVTAYNVPSTAGAVRMFDLTVTQACATADALELLKYHYGGLGFRGTDEWEGKKMCVLTSEGETARDKANGTRCRWCYLGALGTTQERTGIAILGHPGNFRAPQPIRVHPDMPFFSFDPSALGDWSITPDNPYVARYRFIVMDEAPSRASLDAYWNAYAHPAIPEVISDEHADIGTTKATSASGLVDANAH